MEHTELEQELHDKAHIDYDRVAIVRTIAFNWALKASAETLVLTIALSDP